MAIPRTEQEVQEKRTRLGIAFRNTINYLVDLCKGRIDTVDGEWFYVLFIKDDVFNCPTTIQEVQQALANAWWIEEQDIRQELFYYTYKYKLTSNSDARFNLARNIRDYLIYDQRLFSRQSDWEDTYSLQQEEDTEIEIMPGLDMVFAERLPLSSQLPLFNRYIAYLSCILELSIDEIRGILLAPKRQVNRFLKATKEMMED
jgi:hypothetical protein